MRLFLSFYLLIYSTFLTASGFIPDVYYLLSPDCCIQHLEEYLSYNASCTTTQREETGFCFDKSLINFSRDQLIPKIEEKCNFGFCNRCNAPISKSYYSYPDEDDYGRYTTMYNRTNKCNCLLLWFDEDLESMTYPVGLKKLTPEQEYEQFDLVEALSYEWWVFDCNNKVTPNLYYSRFAKPTFCNLESHLDYCSQNPSCQCYWPQCSEKACEISDISYNKSVELMYKPSLVDFHEEIKEYSHFKGTSIEGRACSLVVHSFFYSHHHQNFINLAKAFDNYLIRGASDEISCIYSILNTIQPLYLTLYSGCLKKHPHPKIYYERGMIYSHQGKISDSMFDIQKMIEMAEERGLEDLLNSDLYLQEGKSYAELGLYDEAVKALSKAIGKDPTNKEAFFERAACYFEQGLFEKSIEDFIESGFKSDKIDPKDIISLDFAAGLIKSTAFAAQKSLSELGPMALSSAQGLTNGLWSFVTDPIDCSSSMIQACYGIVSVLMDNDSRENLKLLLPEVADLIDKWESSSSYEKGELMGTIIGHYGVDFVLIAGSAKMIKAYRELKKANNLMTFEGMANLAKKEKLLEQSKKWNKENNKLLDQTRKDHSGRELYKRYRDIADENQLRKVLHKEGIKTFKKPAGIPQSWQVKITEKSGGMKYIHPDDIHTSVRVMPGNPTSPNFFQKKPYVINKKNGKTLDRFHNSVPANSPEAHISLEEFYFRND